MFGFCCSHKQRERLEPVIMSYREMHIREKTVLVNGVLVYLRPHVLGHEIFTQSQGGQMTNLLTGFGNDFFKTIQFGRTHWTRFSTNGVGLNVTGDGGLRLTECASRQQ
jgi:hypothetical protein